MLRIQIILLLASIIPCTTFSQLLVIDNPSGIRTANSQTRSIPISKIKLTGDAEVCIEQNNAMLFDRKNNRVVLLTIDPRTDTVKEYWDLKGHLFPYKQVIRKTGFDSVLYEELRPALLQNGDATASILGVSTDDSCGHLLFSFPLPKILKEKNSYIPEPNYFIYTRNFFSGKKHLHRIDLKSLVDKVSPNYQVASKQSFLFFNEKLLIPLKDSSLQKTSVNLLTVWTKTHGGAFQPDSTFLPFTPSELKELGHDSVRIRSNKYFLYNDNAKLLYNYNKAEKITVKTLMLFNAGKLLDVMEKDGRLWLLVLKKNKVDVMIYDRQLEQVFGQVPLLLPDGCQLSSARFSNGTVAIVSSDKTVLHFLKME